MTTPDYETTKNFVITLILICSALVILFICSDR